MASRPRESSRARELPDGVGAGTAQPGPALRRPWEGGGGTGDPRRLARPWRAWGAGGGGRRPRPGCVWAWLGHASAHLVDGEGALRSAGAGHPLPPQEAP